MPDRQVTTGDTWESIAQKYGVTVAQLKAGNPGVSILSPGLIIRVPNYYAQPSQPTNPPYLAGGQWNAWEALATKPFTNRKDILEQNAFMRQGLGYQSAKTAVTDSQRYQAQYDAWRAAQAKTAVTDSQRYQAQYDAWRAAVGGVDMADFKKQEYGTGAVGGVDMADFKKQEYGTGGTVSTKPQQNQQNQQKQQNKQNRYKLGANYVIYDPNGKIIYSAEHESVDRYNANHPKPPEPVDPTKYFGSVGTYTWKF